VNNGGCQVTKWKKKSVKSALNPWETSPLEGMGSKHKSATMASLAKRNHSEEEAVGVQVGCVLVWHLDAQQQSCKKRNDYGLTVALPR
jgi:hypothetical protein